MATELDAFWDSLPSPQQQNVVQPQAPAIDYNAMWDAIPSPAKPEPSMGQRALQNVALAGQGYLGNFLDEASAYVNAAPAYLGSLTSPNPESFSDIKDRELGIARQVLSQARQDNPVIGTVSEIGGAIASPVGKLKVGKGLLGLIGSGAAQSAVYGAGSGEGAADRIANALSQGGTGAVTTGLIGGASKAAKAVGSAAKNKAKVIERAAYGLTPSDLRVGVRGDTARKAVSESKVWPAEKAFERLKGSLGEYDPAINAQSMATSQKKLGRELGDFINNLDASKKQIGINWVEAKKAIQNNPDLDPTDIKKALQELTKKRETYLGTKQGFKDAQLFKERVAKNAKIGQQTSNARAAVNKELSHRFRKAIEQAAPQHDIAGMNQRISDTRLLRQAFEKAANRAETEAAKPAKFSWATTGGYGVPLLLAGGAGLATQDPSTTIAAALLALGAKGTLGNPTVMENVLAPTMSRFGSGLNVVGKGGEQISPAVARILAALSD